MKEYKKAFGNKYRYISMYAFQSVKHKGIAKGDVYRYLHSYYIIVDQFRYIEIITESIHLSLNELSDKLTEGNLRYFYETNHFVVEDYIGILDSPIETAIIESIVKLDLMKGTVAELETLAAEQSKKAEDIPLLIEDKVRELSESRGKQYYTNIYLGIKGNKLIFVDSIDNSKVFSYSKMGIFSLKVKDFGNLLMSKEEITAWVLKQKLIGKDYSCLK